MGTLKLMRIADAWTAHALVSLLATAPAYAQWLPAGTKCEQPVDEKGTSFLTVLETPRYLASRKQLDEANKSAAVQDSLKTELLKCREACVVEDEGSHWPLILGGGVAALAVSFVLGVVVGK